MTFEEWVRYGLEKGYCGPPVCETHDGLPVSPQEESDFYDGEAPCILILRITEDREHQAEIAENHSPSQWRAHPFYEV